ncbi:uncharacterized protein J4E84_007679 [Alternaria hordeiaustralica]|uniref:uncharacterized protein n=1 Tax=Alternaria hordeiaustralica TaxID=1187925 RepID=UPI0020C39D1B|nr:uncharacterized protein J4E84_007679 [Alternaria hordeiaustralica]KAI4681442.1 hypothetical protein J4E84_007679 [Alternaria hordeiaustralica]
MADPFSITGSAVGVVSLAIQVCKGLEWYLSGVKEAKNKAEQIAAETEELANLLERLETVIGKVDPSQSVSATRTGIVSCANAIATIRKKLKPDDHAANSGIKSSLKRLTKRLAFPFKEADITYWKDALNTIQQSLQTALLALVIDQQRLASENARLHYTQLSVDQSLHHFSNLQLQRDAVCIYVSFQDRTEGFANAFENLGYLFKILLPLMLSEAFETDDRGATCIDTLREYDPPAQNRDAYIGLLRSLFEQDLQITRYTYETASYRSNDGLSILAEIPYESFTSPLLDDSALLEAIFMKSDHQLQEFLHQPKYLPALDVDTLANALIISTVIGWTDGCKVLLNANLFEHLEDPSSDVLFSSRGLLTISAALNRLDMLQFWLSQRETCDEPLLSLIGHIEDALHVAEGTTFEVTTIEAIQLASKEYKILLDLTLRIEHWDDPDYTKQPYPRYSPKDLRRITNEDAHLRARLEQLVPELITQHDHFEGKLQDFVIDVLIPTMRRTAKELKEEDKTLYAAGRRELGVIMDEDEDETEEEENDAEEGEVDFEEESDDEY